MIYIGSDHSGRNLKYIIEEYLNFKAIAYVDCSKENKSTDDYPDVANEVCKNVKKDDIAILICGTGIGMSIAANKIKGIRAALCMTVSMAHLARAHNNANCICLGEKLEIDEEEIKLIIDAFLNGSFEEGRHLRRIDKINKMEL